jgi:hypothetical protein
LKGFNAAQKYQIESNQPIHDQEKVKISFRVSSTHLPETITTNIQCDCEVTKAAELVEFDGDCISRAGTKVPLASYKCLGNSDINESEVDRECSSLKEFDCSSERDQSSSSPTKIEELKPNNNSPKDDKHPQPQPQPPLPPSPSKVNPTNNNNNNHNNNNNSNNNNNKVRPILNSGSSLHRNSFNLTFSLISLVTASLIFVKCASSS